MNFCDFMDIFDCISPLDYRYYGRDKLFSIIADYLSENARIKYQARVEATIAKILSKKEMCSMEIFQEIEEACERVKAGDVYEEEDRIKHDIRALVNCIRKNVSEEAKPFVHLGATSFDIVNTAEALRFKDFANYVIIPELLELEKVLIEIAIREKDTLQIGRTHGQHAEPITFGFAIAGYVSRLGNRIIEINTKANRLKGKLSGAVGAYNATSLFFHDPEQFEKDVLAELGLEPASHSTQIVEPEFLLDFVHSIISCFGVIANFADDMRNLQRSEIGEVGEAFGEAQVGSSTMPHKKNPINFENIKSMWKQAMPRMSTLYMDQISEHQRDLTNSASSRFIPEILVSFLLAADRMKKICKKLAVDREAMKRNFSINREMIVAEPLYILLAAYGHENAHEAVRKLSLKSREENVPIAVLARNDIKIKEYIDKFTVRQLDILENPEKYTGMASKKTEKICGYWKNKLGLG